MMEHEVCKWCRHNNYPSCKGTIMEDGNEMNIEKLNINFKCGQKIIDKPMDFSVLYKSELEIKMETLEARILELESSKEKP